MNRTLPPFAALALLTGLLAGSAVADGNTPAGTAIRNIVVADFIDPDTQKAASVTSNEVVTTVLAQCVASLTAVGSTQATLYPGEQLAFRYTLLNAGNTALAGPIEVRTVTGVLNGTARVYHDRNNNGVLDSGEPELTQVPELAQDAALNLLLLVQAREASDATLQLVTSCGGAATASLTVRGAPNLVVDKSFDRDIIRPETETTVTVSATNGSTYESREVILTDLLTEQIARGMRFVPGSAITTAGTVEYTSDSGTTWNPQAPQNVNGVRVRVPKLEAAASVRLSFRLLATPQVENQTLLNVGQALTSGTTTQDTDTAVVKYQPGVALGPVGNPQASELTEADTQTRAFAVVGIQTCFDHTIRNTGDVRDSFRITVAFPTGNAEASVTQPAAQPLLLEPGASSTVTVCYTPTAAGALEAIVTATGERGTTNATRDVITRIEAGLPALSKAVQATTTAADGTPQPVPSGGTVRVGDTLTYTLSVTNPYTVPLADVVVSDPLPANVDFISASGGGVLAQQTVNWTVTLAPGETRTFTIVAKVAERSQDGESLTNIFNLTTSILPPQESNPVQTPVWNAALAIDKGVSASVASYGDRLTYTLRIRNTSRTTAIVDAIVTDTPARGLEYVAGTSTLGGEALADPSQEGGALKWPVATIPAGGEIVISYQTRVTPEATGELVNTVQVVGNGGTARAIASNRAVAKTKLDPLKFAPISDILGRVFVDRNRNGVYEPDVDLPIERARVILAGGRLALTDADGRYNFAAVPYGTHALRLDPNTTPYPPLSVPEMSGLSGTATVNVRGLTTVNFPLQPLAGDVAALRRTTLNVGELSVNKVVYPTDGGYIVTLTFKTPTALTNFQLLDPLPGGATLKEGRNTFSGTLPAGESYLTYRFEWNGDSSAVTTDPVVNWRK